MKAAYFAGRLRELREAAGLSQAELANKIGQTVRQVSRLETAAQKPSWETAVDLADALGVDCRAFLEAPGKQPEPKRGRPPKDPGEVPPATPSTPPAAELEKVEKKPRAQRRKGK